MSVLKFYNRKSNQTIKIETYCNYVVEILTDLKRQFNLNSDSEIKLFIISNAGKPIVFDNNAKIEYLSYQSKHVRHIELVVTNKNQHGKQTVDMSPVSDGVVISGYKRYVSANVNAGDTIIGDPNGACVRIPAGALVQGNNISIKTVMVDETKLKLPLGFKNVTRAVISDPKKVNDEINQ